MESGSKLISVAFVGILITTLVFPTITAHQVVGLILVIISFIMAVIFFGLGLLKHWRSTIDPKGLFSMFKSLKKWCIIVVITAIGFNLFIAVKKEYPLDGISVARNEEYFIENHGIVIRDLSKDEYDSYVSASRHRLLASAFLFFSFGQLLLIKAKPTDG